VTHLAEIKADSRYEQIKMMSSSPYRLGGLRAPGFGRFAGPAPSVWPAASAGPSLAVVNSRKCAGPAAAIAATGHGGWPAGEPPVSQPG
jgi:hypothetical protein